MLKVILLIIIVIFGNKGLDYLAQQDLNYASAYMPFKFDIGESADNVKGEFFIQNRLLGTNGKEYEVEFDIPDEYFTQHEYDDEQYMLYSVNQDNIQQATRVNIVAKYRKFIFGDAQLIYTLNIVPNSSTISDNIKAIDIQTVESGDYPYDLSVRKNKDSGVVTQITGDIRYIDETGQYIKLTQQNPEDAKIVLDIYKSVFSVPEYIGFSFSSQITVKDIKTIQFKLTYNGI